MKKLEMGTRKLVLSRETIARMSGPELTRVAGGSDDSWSVNVPCPTDVTNCHPCKPPKI